MNLIYQITRNSVFFQPHAYVNNKENIRDPNHWTYVVQIHRQPVDPPQKWTAVRKMCRYFKF